MKYKNWFVTLKQREVEKCKTPAQLLVFTSIKSYCGNGKLQVGLSYRDISKRSKFSIGWIKPIIKELKDLGLVFTHGTESRRGGTVEVFSVGTVDTSQSVPPVEVSVPSVALSVPLSGTKHDNIINEEINNNGDCFPQNKKNELWRILHEESEKEIAKQRRVRQ